MPIIYVNSYDDVFTYNNHCDDNDKYGLKAIYVITNDNQPKAICYNCGKPTLTIINEVEEWGSRSIPCYATYGDQNGDMITEYKLFNGEKCNSCGLYERAYWSSRWKVTCFNLPTLFPNEYYVGEGSNVHCLIDPEDPYKNPLQ